MENDAFSFGIEPGGLRDIREIGILICYMLDNISKPFSSSDLIEIIQQNGIANYFATTSSISELIKNNNIKSDKDGKLLEITDNGRLISGQLYSELPLTIRQKVISSVSKLEENRVNEKQNPVLIQKLDSGGYNVTLKIADQNRDMMALSSIVPSKKEAEQIKKNFHNSPVRVYSVILASLIGDEKLIKETIKELDND